MNTPKQQNINALSFAIEYWNLQSEVSRVTGAPLPPCYYCSATQIWACSTTENDCDVFNHYCSVTGWEEQAVRTPDTIEHRHTRIR